MKSFLSSLCKLDSSAHVLVDRISATKQHQLFTTLLLSSAIGLIASALPALAGTTISSTPSVSETGEAIGYTVDAVSLSNSYGTTVCTLTSSRNFNITLPVGATVRKAILYWATDLTAGDSQVTLAGSTINASKSWSDTILTTTKTYNGYRADVTSQITGAGTYSFSGLSSAPTSIFNGGCLSGASLIVIYNTTRSDPNALNRIEMFDGFEGIRGALPQLASGGASSTVTLPINSLGSDLSFMTALSWQGNIIDEPPGGGGYNDTLTVNGTAVSNTNNPVNDNGNGSGANQAPNSVYAVDADTYDISSITSTGPTSLTITNASGNFDYVISQGFVFGSRGPDVSDAPNSGGFSYGIARHKIVPTLINPSLYLGSKVDGEVVDNTYAGNTNADFDNTNAVNDDDGISSFPTLTAGAASYSIPAANITATGTGTLHAWIDFNKNGTFDAGEYTSVAVTSNTPASALNWTGITAGAAGNTFARFRFTTDATVAASTPSGLATDGEVEDYQLSIAVAPPPPIVAGQSFCSSPYGEVYATRAPTSPAQQPNRIYAIHGPTGAGTLLTTSTIPSVTAINGMGTDHVNKLVYYADANGIYAWNALTNTHITVTSNFTSFLPSSYTSQYSVTTLSSGGAAFYNGSLYVGVDGIGVGNSLGSNPHFEIFKVDFTPNGQTVTAVTPLDVVGKSAIGNPTEQLKRTDEDWGDFIISDTGMILGLSNRFVPSAVTHIWNYNLNAAAGTNPYTNLGLPTGNHQIAKSGDGKIWALFSTGNVQEITAAGAYLGTAIDMKPGFGPSDGGECVVGNSRVGDRVWSDTNGDGIQDTGEPGIPGVSVSIYRDINKNGVRDTFDTAGTKEEPLLATKITDANGNYNFTELLPHDVLTGTGHNDFIVKVTGGVPSGYKPTGTTATTGATTAIDLSSASQVVTTADFSYVPSNPNLLLVKRITAINGNTTNGSIFLNTYDYETDPTNPSYPYDKNVIQSGLTPPNSDKWPNTSGTLPLTSTSSSFLLGARNGGTTKPNDTVEYTIYFLSAGDSEAKNVLLCDRVPDNVTFSPHTFTNTTINPGGIARGIAVQIGSTLTHRTNTGDSDLAQYFPPGVEPSTVYGTKVNCGGANNNGAVVVDLQNRPSATGTKATDEAAGAYGFVRFQGVVK